MVQRNELVVSEQFAWNSLFYRRLAVIASTCQRKFGRRIERLTIHADAESEKQRPNDYSKNQ